MPQISLYVVELDEPRVITLQSLRGLVASRCEVSSVLEFQFHSKFIDSNTSLAMKGIASYGQV